MKLAKLQCLLAVMVLPVSLVFAQTGKIAGTVTDAGTGEPLIGVNVVIDGTTQGATTDLDGYYVILNVKPGTYTIRASYIGYTPQVIQDVRVNIDLTTNLDFTMREESVDLDEVVVTSERPVVQRDISASVSNLSAEEIENLPVTDVEKVIGLQAGFERGLTIRGSGGDQVQFLVDGMSMTTGRDNTPFTGISYTAVDEVQVQTGGFNAEYGNVRSGLVNVVTKEGPRDRYIADVIVRYSPATQKHFGPLPTSKEEGYFMRPYFDEATAVNGTGAWPSYLADQYATFEGWASLQEKYKNSTGQDVTIAQMQEAYEWYMRKNFEINDPDYEVDGTIGGPIPLIGRYLGDLRFIASYRNTQSAYIVPFVRDVYDEQTFQGRLTSDVAPGMKLNIQGMWAKQEGINDNEQGWPNMWTGDMPFYPWDNEQPYLANNLAGDHIFATHWRNPMDVTRNFISAQFTHTLSPKTFYEVQLQRNFTDYSTFTTEERDRETILKTIGPIQLTEEPFGWEWRDTYDVLGVGRRNGGHWFSARDSSQVTRWQAKFDVTSQLNRFSMLKAGVEYITSNYDTNFGEVDPAHPHHANPKFVWERSPVQGALYVQNKLEFKGMVANVGLRLDYFHSGGEWYVYEPFERAFSAQIGRDEIDEVLDQQPTERQFALSPRLGVSFPITDNSKLYFNYGHFRNMLNPISLFNIEEINTGAVNFIGNPNHPMPKTVAYELGYEQNIADQFLLRLAGYYRDLRDQPRGVRFQSIDGEVNYATDFPYNYGDVRGFEVTLSKNRGAWIRGFVNYTFMASKGGNFGFSNVYENRVTMRQYLLTTTDHYQSKPIPEPYARFNIEVLVPEDLGPQVGNVHPLGDWRINFLGEWRKGQSLTWTGQQMVEGRSPVQGLQGNVRWKDFYNLDMRFSKVFDTSVGKAQFFVDVTNVLNLKRMNRYGVFMGNQDDVRYYQSLHLPENTFEALDSGNPYPFIPGNDKPGDVRKEGVAFTPIKIVGELPASGEWYDMPDLKGPLYYHQDEGVYYRWNGSSFERASDSFVEQVLDDKAYIDMPNNRSYTFFNPRNVFFGLRLSF